MRTTFDAFVASFHQHATSDPNARIGLGLDHELGQLPDPSLAEGQRRIASARALLAQVDTLDPAELSFDQALDADLARLMLQREIHAESLTFNGRTTRQQQPRGGDELGDGLFLLFANDPRPAPERLADITARLEATPRYLDALLERLDTPVARWVEIEATKLRGLDTLLDTLTGWSEDVGFADHQRLCAARVATEAALERYLQALEALPTTEALHLDRADAQRIVDLKAVDRSLEDLHAMARGFLAETNEVIEELRGRLVVKHKLPADTSTEALQQHLAAHYRVALPTGSMDDVLQRYEQERARILEWIQERQLFPVFEEQDMRILCTPTFMEPSIPAGAMMSPPPFRDGVRTSLVYLTLKPELLDEHTEIGIPSMMIHEGIPGHHLQLATASRHSSTIRRHFEGMEHAEGWTTMLEDYMLDQGYMGELTDEARFCGKRDIARIGARVAIDLFFMTGDRGMLDVGVPCDLSSPDPFVAAGNLLAAVTGFVPPRVEAELNWYSQERGYPLSYLTGNKLVWQLKEELIAAQAGKLEGLALDREFHRIFLESGNMPVTYLWRVFRNEGLLPEA